MTNNHAAQNNPPNPVVHFTKQNYPILLCRNHKERNLKDFCRNFFFDFMDAKGRVRFDEPIVRVIESLTGRHVDSIRRKLREMVEDGEISRPAGDDCTVIVNPTVANRQGMLLDYDLPYEGKDPIFDEEDRELFEKLRRLRAAQRHYAEVKAMNASQELHQQRARIKELEAEVQHLHGRIEGQRDVFRMGIGQSIDTSIDKIREVIDSQKDEHGSDERPRSSIRIVRDHGGPMKYEVKH